MEKTKSEKILDELCQNIGGEWLLIGGTLIQLQYDGERSTEDIDLVHISHAEKSKEFLQNELFRFVQRCWGIGPEHINLSAEFFVHELAGWQAELVPLKDGPKGRIFQPSLTLLIALKARRGSELDLQDIQTAIKKQGLRALDETKLERWVPETKLKQLKKLLGLSC